MIDSIVKVLGDFTDDSCQWSGVRVLEALVHYNRTYILLSQGGKKNG